MIISYDWLFGIAVGFVIMDEEDAEFMEAEWGATVFLGPLVITFYKPKESA